MNIRNSTKSLKIILITPTPKNSLTGNNMTAIRWAVFLKELGHEVKVNQTYDGKPYDVMIALHARRSFDAIELFHRLYKTNPLIVILTGTDLYQDIQTDNNAKKSLEMANRLIVLQHMGIRKLPDIYRKKTRVVYQSAKKISGNFSKRKRTFDIAVIGHLRPIKDPFCTARASRQLPDSSKARIIHLGLALDNESKIMAQKEMSENSRYNWKGALPHWKTIRILASSQLLVVSSEKEGGANVISESIIVGVPILASKISSTVGMLGEEYPGYYPFGNANKLASLISKAENDPPFLKELRQYLKKIAHKFEPKAEKSSIKNLISEFSF